MAAEYKTIVSLVRDRPGVLTRIASMFRRRNFNIVSLAVGQSETKGLSRMTFVVDGDDATIDQVIKQLRKLIDVVSVEPIGDRTMVARELALIRVTATSATRSEITQIAEIFRANVIDVAPDSLIIEVTGDEDKVQSLKSLLESFGVREMIRTGRVAMERGLALDSLRNGKTTIPKP
jgi:acetolactate synthase-1/3 small subunit